MKILLVILITLALAGCSALSGVSDQTVNSIANAGGGCVKVNGVWGSGIILVGNADKGVIRNGELVVAGDCGGVTVRDAATVRAVPPIPGTVTVTTVPGTITTTVQPAPKP